MQLQPLELSISVFEIRRQRAFVLPDLKPPELIRSILAEFRELEYLGTNIEDYRLVKYNSQDDRAFLDPKLPIGRQLVPQDHLHLIEADSVEATRQPRNLYLREQSTGQVYRLHQLPAILGRQSQGETLTVDLDLHAQGMRVSRHHARITDEGDQFFVKNLTSNPTSIKRQTQATIQVSQKQPLLSGDIIRLDRSQIELKFIVREKRGTLAKQAHHGN